MNRTTIEREPSTRTPKLGAEQFSSSKAVLTMNHRFGAKGKVRNSQAESDTSRVEELTPRGETQVTLSTIELLGHSAEATKDVVEMAEDSQTQVRTGTNHYGPEQRLTQQATVLAEWIGAIEHVSNGVVRATLSDINSPETILEIVEIRTEKFSPSDHALLEPGNTFYWTLGTEQSAKGTVRKFSHLWLRRMPRWTAQNIIWMKDQAATVSSGLVFNE